MDRFHYMAMADNRQRIMPMPDDRLPGRSEPLAYPEAVLLTNPINPDLKGEDFTFVQMAPATNNFNNSTQIGQRGYGKVYKVILADGSIVAIKRALEGSLQGEKEFLTEIELLSRVHHRNLVALMG
ncbi:hypothetical protein IFM89_003231 [Coptis chinensis]|uniref:Protein kinase domain-containing protein n=1 Tax=Coptis chinensis TaxID=261450 RepID=A0A835LE57_9MAGN|nr:hypothetical protein IFM89_003231 [Coptis chinensis]